MGRLLNRREQGSAAFIAGAPAVDYTVGYNRACSELRISGMIA